MKDLQNQILRIQQGLFHQKGRAVIALEGFDASGKGGFIRRLTEKLDPRGVTVHPIAAPSPQDQAKHYLYRFWQRLPAAGTLAVFDRTWYGRVLVERVDHLIPPPAWKRAYQEINEFERMLTDDGIQLIKIFLAIDRDEQYRRFEARLKDPYKQWKLTEDDIRARKKWKDYVKATDDLLRETHTKWAPWTVIPANDKGQARIQGLELIGESLHSYGKWMEKKASQGREDSLEKLLSKLK